MDDRARTAVVTGATSGLGKECARALLSRDPSRHVVLAVRDRDRGEAVAAELGAPNRCAVIVLDLGSLSSVQQFIEAHRRAAVPPTDAVVCNAGIQVVSGGQTTADGLELTFGVNHLGHFALVDGLLDQLSAPARIVVVSSDTHDPAKRTGMPSPRYTTAAQLARPDNPLDGRTRYTTSKLCNILFSYELSRRVPVELSSVNAFNPGLMPGSGLARDYTRLQRLGWRYLMPALRILPQVRSSRQSGRDLAALATDPAFAGVTGAYFDGLDRIPSSPESYDPAKALDLWEASERLIARSARFR